MARKIPMRRCVVSHEQLPKNDLLRIVRTPDQELKIDLTGRLNGRGAYLKKDVDIVEKAKKSKILERTFEMSISDEFYDEIKRVIGSN